MSKTQSQLSRELDDAAREAGIQISRYQQPLDLAKMKTTPTGSQLFAPVPSPNTSTLISSPSPFSNPPTINTAQKSQTRLFHDIIAPTNPTSSIHQLPDSQSSSPSIATKALPTNRPKSNVSQKVSTTKTKPEQLLIQKPHPTTSSIASTLSQHPSADNSSKPTTLHENDNFTLDDKNAKAAEFFRIIETKLAPELKLYQTKREKAARDLHDYEQLIQTIYGLRLARKAGQKTMEAKVDLGCKVMADAKFVNSGKIMLDIGLGFFFEMSFDEAIEHIKVKCDQLHKMLTAAEDQCCLWSSRIKAMHEAIGVLTQISESLEELPPLRDVYFQ